MSELGPLYESSNKITRRKYFLRFYGNVPPGGRPKWKEICVETLNREWNLEMELATLKGENERLKKENEGWKQLFLSIKNLMVNHR